MSRSLFGQPPPLGVAVSLPMRVPNTSNPLPHLKYPCAIPTPPPSPWVGDKYAQNRHPHGWGGANMHKVPSSMGGVDSERSNSLQSLGTISNIGLSNGSCHVYL